MHISRSLPRSPTHPLAHSLCCVAASLLLRIRYPAIEVIRALRTILVISRLDVAHVIFRNGFTPGINIDLVKARRVQAEDFLFVLIGDSAVAELLLHLWR